MHRNSFTAEACWGIDIGMKYSEARRGRSFVIRLEDGDVIHEVLEEFARKHRIKAAYLPEAITAMRMGGASNVSLAARRTANQMDRRAWEINGLKPLPWTLTMKPLRKLPQFLGRGTLAPLPR